MTRKEAKEYLDNYRKMYAELATETFLEALDVILEESSENIGQLESEDLEAEFKRKLFEALYYTDGEGLGRKKVMKFADEVATDLLTIAAEWQKERLDGSAMLHIAEKSYKIGRRDCKERVIGIIEGRIAEILGDGQPAPILRYELQDIIERIKED